jgi:hypothetical protein
LLEQVRTELGSGTKIVSANKIRTGGVGGFFARENYEVIVEHDGIVVPPPQAADDPSVSVRPRDIAAPTLMDLVDRVSSQERAAHSISEAVAASPRSSSEAVAANPRSSSEAVAANPAPRISTESEPFASVLQRVAHNAGVAAETPHDDTIDLVESSADDLVEEVDAELVEPIDAPPAPRVPLPAAPPVMSAPLPSAPVAATPMPAQVNLPAAGGHVGALVKMGLPATYVPAVPSPAALEAALRASLTRLPEAPAMPRSTGSVVAVVGERNAAMEIARDLSAQAGLDPDSITVATRKRMPARTPEHLVINGSEEAAERRRSWRRRERPSVVVIDAELGRDKQGWAYHVLAALEPSATWGVVDATRKTEDVAAWVNGLGGVDALAVNDLDATVSPASVLQLDVPVGRLDGRPASPALWAALLTERLAA